MERILILITKNGYKLNKKIENNDKNINKLFKSNKKLKVNKI